MHCSEKCLEDGKAVCESVTIRSDSRCIKRDVSCSILHWAVDKKSMAVTGSILGNTSDFHE